MLLFHMWHLFGPSGSFIMLKSPSQAGRQNPPFPQSRFAICDSGECHNNVRKQDEIKLDMAICRGILRYFAKAYHISHWAQNGSFTAWLVYRLCETDNSFALINVPSIKSKVPACTVTTPFDGVLRENETTNLMPSALRFGNSDVIQ